MYGQNPQGERDTLFQQQILTGKQCLSPWTERFDIYIWRHFKEEKLKVE
jgi:hypothetical protein